MTKNLSDELPQLIDGTDPYTAVRGSCSDMLAIWTEFDTPNNRLVVQIQIHEKTDSEISKRL